MYHDHFSQILIRSRPFEVKYYRCEDQFKKKLDCGDFLVQRAMTLGFQNCWSSTFEKHSLYYYSTLYTVFSRKFKKKKKVLHVRDA